MREREETLIMDGVNKRGQEKELPFSCRAGFSGQRAWVWEGVGTGIWWGGAARSYHYLKWKRQLGAFGSEGRDMGGKVRTKNRTAGRHWELFWESYSEETEGESSGEWRAGRFNPNCRGSSSKSGLLTSLFKWLCKQLVVDQPLYWSADPQGNTCLPLSFLRPHTHTLLV